MANKPTVTQAQIRRAVLGLQAMGKFITGVRLEPSGAVTVLCGDGSQTPLIPDGGGGGGGWDDYDREHAMKLDPGGGGRGERS